MGLREIKTIPDEVLRRKSKKVTVFDKELSELIDDMFETMRCEPGVGLAAPQVNVSKRVIVIEYAENEGDQPKFYALINPEITISSEETEFGIEGCLSIPNIAGEVERYSNIVVKGFNKHGNKVKVKANGWLARIFQHEIDHLDGILFTDRAIKIWQTEVKPTQPIAEK